MFQPVAKFDRMGRYGATLETNFGRSNDLDGTIDLSYYNWFGLLERWTFKVVQSVKEGDKKIVNCFLPFFYKSNSLNLSLSQDRQFIYSGFVSGNKSFKANYAHTNLKNMNTTNFLLGFTQSALDFNPLCNDDFFDYITPQNSLQAEVAKSWNLSDSLMDLNLGLKSRLDYYLKSKSVNSKLEFSVSNSLFFNSKLRFYQMLEDKTQSKH